MKKLLVVAVAVLVSASAFAQKSMVKLEGCLDDGRCNGADLYMSGNDTENAEEKNQTIALNYAYLFTDNFGAGLSYKTVTDTQDGKVQTAGDSNSTIGLDFYWNLEGGWDDTCFAALHYNMVTNEDKDGVTDSGSKDTAIVLEYGHRFKIANAWGLNLNYVPSATYSMNTNTPSADGGKDVKSTALALNLANFAVTF